MKGNMKCALTVILLAAAIFIGALEADAAIKITIKNNRSHSMSFAFCWAGLDYEYDVSKGWYIVKAGESKTFTIKEAAYPLTSQNFGYYAMGGGSVWKGKSGGEYSEFWIHTKQAFTGNHDDPISGGQKVPFRIIKLKRTGGDGSVDGSATLTFNP
jgi:hypothetical protein